MYYIRVIYVLDNITQISKFNSKIIIINEALSSFSLVYCYTFYFYSSK